MAYLIFYYFLVTTICFWVGALFYTFSPAEEIPEKKGIHLVITGLIILTAFAQWAVLISPLNISVLFGILALCLIISFFRRNLLLIFFKKFRIFWKSKPALFYVCAACMLIMILVLNAGKVIMDDSESYHIQMIKWIQEYGTVPGIANLHLRFGFNSSWFIASGLLTYPFRGFNTYISLNGLLCFWFCIFLLDNIFSVFTADKLAKPEKLAVASFFILALCLVNWPMIRGTATNANYDFITSCCVVVLFAGLFSLKNKAPVEWLIWPVFLFTVRIINFPLLLLSLVFFVQFIEANMGKKFLMPLGAAAFILLPFIIRNCILSGYILLPVYQLDLFSFDWKADKMKVMEISQYIKYFNRINPMFQPMMITEKMNLAKWLPAWFSFLFRFDKLILILSFAGYLTFLLNTKKIKRGITIIFFTAMLVQLISWIFLAPDPRFVYGPMLVGICSALLIIPSIQSGWIRILKPATLVTCCSVLLYAGFKIADDSSYRNFLTPKSLPAPPCRTIFVGNIRMNIPVRILNNWNARCYDVQLPCLYSQDPRLENRGDRISDGFRLKNNGELKFTGGEYKIGE